MSIPTETTKHVHVLRTWKLYPRVQYFYRRLADLKQRFSRTINAFPERFHDKNVLDEVERLYRCIGKLPRIIVTGDDILKDFEITREDANSTTEETLEVRLLCKSDWQLENWKQYLVTLREANESIDIVVVGTLSSQENEYLVQSIESLKTWLRNEDIPVLFCPSEKELSNEIEKVLEEHIISGFEHMFLYMHNYFIRKVMTFDAKSTDFLDEDIIVAEVKNIVQDGDAIGAYKENLITSSNRDLKRLLCRRLLCAFVQPLAANYSIPDFLCYQLLTELHFEKSLNEAVLINTLDELSKLCHVSGQNKGVLSEEIACKVYSIAKMLRKDLQKAAIIKTVDKTFQTAQRVTTVMKKMMFEIRGYLRQSLASSSILEIETPSVKIPDELRRDILRNKSVYGMGTMYGELEIHLKSKLVNSKSESELENSKSESELENSKSESELENSKSESDVIKEISEQMRKHRYAYPYSIRVVELEPVPFFRQGDITLSPFPGDMTGDHRMGTAGCFVKDQLGIPNLLTCSHVVDPGRKHRHVVQVRKRVNGELATCRFGLSSPQKTIRPSDSTTFPLIDIAAATASDDDQLRRAVDYNMRNDDGENMPVSFLSGLSGREVGMTVYKYGATTNLTHGLICSSDYCRAENEQADEDADNNQCDGPVELYILIIDDLPVNSDNDKVLEGSGNFEREEQARYMGHIFRGFADKGDSGAIVCFNDYYVDPAGTIVAASMLNGGEYKLKGDPSPKCTSFLLARGLEELVRKGHCFSM